MFNPLTSGGINFYLRLLWKLFLFQKQQIFSKIMQAELVAALCSRKVTGTLQFPLLAPPVLVLLLVLDVQHQPQWRASKLHSSSIAGQLSLSRHGHPYLSQRSHTKPDLLSSAAVHLHLFPLIQWCPIAPHGQRADTTTTNMQESL